ncbi:MAG: DNA polymerase, partial [Pseudomonadota bacterium]
GTLETLLERAGEIKQNKRRENLIEFADLARISKRLVTLDQQTPLDVALNELELTSLDGPKLIAFLKGLELNTLTRRVATQTEVDAANIDAASVGPADSQRGPDFDGPADNAGEAGSGDGLIETKTPAGLAAQRLAAHAALPVSHDRYETIRTLEDLERWVADGMELGLVAVDTETTSLDAMQADLVGVSLAIKPGQACYIPLAHVDGDGDLLGGGALLDGQIPIDAALQVLKPLLEAPSVLKIAQNIKYDWVVLNRYGIKTAPFDDTMLLSYALDAGRAKHGMDGLSQAILGHTPIPFKDVAGSGKKLITFDKVPIEKATAYAAEDADVTLRLWEVLKPRLVPEGMTTVYERLERPLVEVICRMEARGISVDRQILSRLSGHLAQKAAGLEDEIYQLAGQKFNVGSPKQLGEILFDQMGLPGGKKTKTGQWATGAQQLEDLAAEGHELPRKIVDWRQLTKLKSTYTDALPGFINPITKRVHTSYAMASTTTGRLSSSDPNLQNIPVRTEEGRKIRTAFVAESGNKLVSADYSQIELRVLAHVADIPQLRQAFADGMDIHAITASEMFGVPVEGMDPMVRRQAKAINFGIIYGISAFGLANNLGIERSEASDYIKKYFERFPGIHVGT